MIPQKYTFNSVPFGDQNQKYTNTPITETSSSNNPSSNLLGTQLNYNDIRAQLSRGIISQAQLENEKNLNLLVNQYQPQSNKEKLIIIPGMKNKLLVMGNKLLPRSI